MSYRSNKRKISAKDVRSSGIIFQRHVEQSSTNVSPILLQ